MNDPIHVLLVEDNPGDADLTRDSLADSKVRLEVAVAVDGAEALAYLHREPPFQSVPVPDLILLDLNLPKLDGRQVLAEIRKSERLRKVPVVILTSSEAETDIVRSYELGANCYVTKPVGLAAFQAIVRSVDHFWFTVVKLP